MLWVEVGATVVVEETNSVDEKTKELLTSKKWSAYRVVWHALNAKITVTVLIEKNHRVWQSMQKFFFCVKRQQSPDSSPPKIQI